VQRESFGTPWSVVRQASDVFLMMKAAGATRRKAAETMQQAARLLRNDALCRTSRVRFLVPVAGEDLGSRVAERAMRLAHKKGVPLRVTVTPASEADPRALLRVTVVGITDEHGEMERLVDPLSSSELSYLRIFLKRAADTEAASFDVTQRDIVAVW
jgi:hypothetical protein